MNAFQGRAQDRGCVERLRPATQENGKEDVEPPHHRMRVLRGGKPRFVISPKTLAFQKTFYPGVTRAEWGDWHWQVKNRIRTVDRLTEMFELSQHEITALISAQGHLPLSVTPYYASLLSRTDPEQALRRTVIPVSAESCVGRGEAADPLGEESDSPVPGLVHRYPDRVLFLVTDFCSTFCRYCTRSRMVGESSPEPAGFSHWEKALEYIGANSQIRDVLLSGGDPLTLPDDRLEWLLSHLRRIPHVEMIRIGTKTPAVLPQRITPQLCRMLKRYHPLWMSLHFTHPDELTPETAQACGRLADAGIPLGSQTVLLSGINDDAALMTRLMQGLLKMRVRPYYLYQCDPIEGSSHFRTSVSKGLEIIQGLRGHTSGYAVPQYVIDAPGGGGKIPLLPDYVVGHQHDQLILKNYRGLCYRYPDNGGESV